MAGRRDLRIGGILLAAGGSTRLGTPKQLVDVQGSTLIKRAAEALVEAGCHPIVAVLGAETERSTAELAEFDIHIEINSDWNTGIGSSIRCGINWMDAATPGVDAAVITLCDQPEVGAAQLGRLIQRFWDGGARVVASSYGSSVGVPALFSRELFAGLMQLEGDRGAKSIIESQGSRLATIELPEAAFDIDSVSDLVDLESRA